MSIENPSPSRIHDYPTFVQIDPFPRLWAALRLGDDDLRRLEAAVMASPTRNPVIAGTEGLRKVRLADRGAGRGKSGGYRVFYVYVPERGKVLLMGIIDKGTQPSLNRAERNAFAQVIRRLMRDFDREIG